MSLSSRTANFYDHIMSQCDQETLIYDARKRVLFGAVFPVDGETWARHDLEDAWNALGGGKAWVQQTKRAGEGQTDLTHTLPVAALQRLVDSIGPGDVKVSPEDQLTTRWQKVRRGQQHVVGRCLVPKNIHGIPTVCDVWVRLFNDDDKATTHVQAASDHDDDWQPDAETEIANSLLNVYNLTKADPDALTNASALLSVRQLTALIGMLTEARSAKVSAPSTDSKTPEGLPSSRGTESEVSPPAYSEKPGDGSQQCDGSEDVNSSSKKQLVEGKGEIEREVRMDGNQ